ncbi:hypothetical protein ACFC0K_36485 [Streptomyces hydrogenans]|uniref:hypothetical protein n=1 Tax=Streptomyces hydrogenans TaxID=1873719 RepID=UPI0035DDE210
MKRGLRTAAAAAVMLGVTGCSSGQSGVPALDGAAPAPSLTGPYRLQTPATLLNGTFTESDHSEPDQGIATRLSGQIDKGVSAFAAYRPTDAKSEHEGPVLAVTGVYGTVLNPVTARDQFLEIADSRLMEGARSTVIIGPRTITPQGFSEPVFCRIVQETSEFGTTWGPSCAWADGSAVAEVAETVDRSTAKDPAEFDLEAFAVKTATIRNEVRIPVTP